MEGRARSSFRAACAAVLLLAGVLSAVPAAAQAQPDLTSRTRLGLVDGQPVRLRVLRAPEQLKFRLCPRDGRSGRQGCAWLTPLNPTRNVKGTYRTQVLASIQLPGVDCRAQRNACEIRAYAARGPAFDRITVDFAPPPVCRINQAAPTQRPPRAGLDAVATALAAPELQAVVAGVSVHIEGYGEIIGVNPDHRLVPASNQKIFAAIGAYELLPADHRFVTRVGSMAGADTDLVLVAGGDPTLVRFGNHSTGDLARQVAAHFPEPEPQPAPGEPAGPTVPNRAHFDRLVIDATRFRTDGTAVGWPEWTVPRYAGPLSAFTLDDNDWRDDAAYVADPAAGNGEQFRAALAEVGVVVDEVVVSDRPITIDTELARTESARTRVLLDRMLRYSDNEIADNIVMEVGHVIGGRGSPATGVHHINLALGQFCPALAGTSHDGSGLSYSNLRSTREWQQLLRAAALRPWWGEFYAHLPEAGGSGTLRRRFGDPSTIGNVRAKTGTVFGARALSGYATTVGGREMTFSIIVNGDNNPTANALGALDDVIVAAVEIDQ